MVSDVHGKRSTMKLINKRSSRGNIYNDVLLIIIVGIHALFTRVGDNQWRRQDYDGGGEDS